jgi:hypothetical protein
VIILLSIDPGKTAGYALFHDNTLVACGLDRDTALNIASAYPNLVLIEKPQVYRTRLQKGDPNDLITLALQAGRYQERAIVAGATVETPTPADWKKQLPKEICNARTLAALSVSERKIADAVKCAAGARHNLLDACGIGLWRLGRGFI